MKQELTKRLVEKIRKLRDGKDHGKDALERRLHELLASGKDFEVRDTQVSGLILRVRPSGMMTYTLVYARGKRIDLGSATEIDHDQAREVARKKLGQFHVTGEDPIDAKKRLQATNYLHFLSDAYSMHLKTTLRKGINNERNVTETLACLKAGFPEFHSLPLTDITPFAIEKWKQRRRQEGVSVARIARQLNDLRACLNRAVKWGALDVSPFEKVERAKPDSSAKVRYLTPEEEGRLRVALDAREGEIRAARCRGNEWRAERGYPQYADLSEQEYADYLKPAVLLSLNTGLRRGELLSLEWTDIDFDLKILTVRGDGSKTGQTRHVPLNREALNVLHHWKQQPGLKSKWVFHHWDGKPFRNLRKAWIAVLKEAKIPNFRWHDLRHTFASNLAIAGIDLNTVRELLGHSDYKMTLRYAHLTPEVKHRAVESLVKTSEMRQ